MFDQAWNFLSAENVLKSDGKYNRTYVAVPIANPGVTDSYLDAPNGIISGINGVGITKNCENPDRLLAFYDWLLQKDVQNYLSWGEEGKDFSVVNGNGRILTKERRDLINDSAQKRDLTGDTLWQYCPKMQGLYEDGSPCTPTDSTDEFKASQYEYDQNFLSTLKINYPAEVLSEPVKRPDYYPVWGFTIEDGSAAMTANTKFNDVSRKYLPRLIMSKADVFDALWDKYVKDFNACNPQVYLDEVNRQIKEKMSK